MDKKDKVSITNFTNKKIELASFITFLITCFSGIIYFKFPEIKIFKITVYILFALMLIIDFFDFFYAYIKFNKFKKRNENIKF